MARDIAQPSQQSARIEPTRDEARNGWTAESLTAYLAQRRSETVEFARLEAELNHKRRVARAETTRDFNPHDWLRG